MKVVYLDHRDSFADLIAYKITEAGQQLVDAGRLAQSVDVKMFRSDCDLDRIVEESPELLLLGPGPNSPTEAGNYLEALQRFQDKYPIFGICLGFQAMMHHFGSPVVVLDEAVHGAKSELMYTASGLFESVHAPAEFARYHSLGTYTLPDGFTRLAYCQDTNGKEIVMAAQHNTLPIAGVQFHPESFMSSGDDSGIKLLKNAIICLTNHKGGK